MGMCILRLNTLKGIQLYLDKSNSQVVEWLTHPRRGLSAIYRFESCPDYKKLKVMKKDTKDTLKVVGIMIMFTSLLLYSFYVHRNEPHWFETRYVKIVK